MQQPLSVHPQALFTTDGGDPILLCPVCQFDYTHALGAWTRVGTDPHEAESAHVGTIPLGVAEQWRRSALVVAFTCESGHRFAVVFQQHKGLTFVSVERWQDEPDPEQTPRGPDPFEDDLRRWAEDAEAQIDTNEAAREK